MGLLASVARVILIHHMDLVYHFEMPMLPRSLPIGLEAILIDKPARTNRDASVIRAGLYDRQIVVRVDVDEIGLKRSSGKEDRLCYTESVLMENRNGLMIDLRVGQRAGRMRARAGDAPSDSRAGRITVAGDKGYDTAAFVASCRALKVTPHVAQNERRPGGSG
jgi:hypothetical protein